jgi:hypothetical protein
VTRTTPTIALACGLAAALSGCGGSELSTSTLSLPKIDLLEPADKVVGTPIEVYTRIARGALACWFGASGPLKGTHIYHADAEPRGGRSEIVIFERDPTAASPRTLKAFRVQIAPEAEQVLVASENLKLPEALATAMKADVKRWSVGAIGCSETPSLPAGWAPQAPEAAPAGPPAAKPAPPARAERERRT